MLLQPLDDVRDYFGEKVAFYFAWMEHYSRYLFFLAILAVIVVIIEVRCRSKLTRPPIPPHHLTWT